MNIIRNVLFAVLLLLVSSCGNICRKDLQTEEKKSSSADSAVTAVQQKPTTIQMNKSIVLAEVLDIKAEEGSMYTLTIKVLEISEDPAYPSFASKDITYTLRPAYGVDEKGGLLKNDINDGLLRARALKAGEKIKGIISLQRDMKWYLENLINNE